MPETEPPSVSSAFPTLAALIEREIAQAGGWIGFDRYMERALYAPGWGYYANAGRKFGRMPASGSDFVTAPELSPLFGQALGAQVAQVFDTGAPPHVWEFGAGSGALAEQLMTALAGRIERYTIVDLSGSLRERQRERLAAFEGRVDWADRLPDAMDGVLLGNEVLDAMPVQLLAWDGARWAERGVAVDGGRFVFADRPTGLRPPVQAPFVPGTQIEIHPQAEAFVRTLAGRLRKGAAFFVDYGFPQAEYYHPQRIGGTLMCHRAHLADTDPLQAPGSKDITAHVDFTGVALAGHEAGFELLGYTSQARFLVNCGLAGLLEAAQARGDYRTLADAQKLLAEHEMGELFKAIGFARGLPGLEALGFAQGDRSHRL